jgi:hypothetical protein
MEENEHPVRNKRAWAAYMEAERRELELRRSGHLARILGISQASEARGELARLALDDQRRAEAGLVELRSPDGEVSYKQIEALTPEDRTARAEAERVRAEWLRRRLAGQSITDEGE